MPIPVRIVTHDAGLDLRALAQARSRFPGSAFIDREDDDEFLEEMSRCRPDLVICGIDETRDHDLGLLQLLRRIAPDVPLLILASQGSLELQRRMRPLTPLYFAVRPIDADELDHVIDAALSQRGAESKGAKANRATERSF